MNPIHLSVDGSVEIVVSATEDVFEPRARLCAQQIADKLGLGPERDAAADVVKARLPRHKLERVNAFIDANLSRRLHVGDLAAVAYLSPFHFTRLLKQATGLSPHAYLTFHRIERAKRMLAESGLALVEVAARVGFQTQGHFTEVFRRHAGTTPRRFRVRREAGA